MIRCGYMRPMRQLVISCMTSSLVCNYSLLLVSCSCQYVKSIMSENQQKKPDLGLLEEDDEFEEFPAEGLLKLTVLGRVKIERITNRSFTYASPMESAPFFILSPSFCLLSSWFTSSCTHPHHSRHLRFAPTVFTPSTFHSRLKTHFFHLSFPP